jgi:hypothetical protein
VLAPGGRLALSVFAEIEHNPAARALAAAVDRHLGDGASLAKRSEHALSDARELRTLLADAGFDGIVLDRARKSIRFPSAREYARIQLAATPLAALVTGLDSAARGRLTDALAAELAGAPGITTGDDVFAFPQELHLALASNVHATRRRPDPR